MKILICGNAQNLVSYMSEKFVRESHSVYQIINQDYEGHQVTYKNKNVIVYNVDFTKKFVKNVILNVNPDVIIFLGANDESNYWDTHFNRQEHYLEGLVNLLHIAHELNVGRFIYLSDYGVFGDLPSDRREAGELQPKTLRDIAIAAGETICSQFREAFKLDTIILRIDKIYGIPCKMDYKSDPFAEYCWQVLNQENIRINEDAYHQYTYISDAVEAIYISACKEKLKNHIYNVSGGEAVKDSDVAEYIWFLAGNRDLKIVPVKDNKTAAKRVEVSNDIFAEEFHYSEYVNIIKGTQKVFEWVKKNLKRFPSGKKEDKPGNERKSAIKLIFHAAMPYFENLFLLFLAVFATYTMQDITYLKNIDFMLIYVILVATAFGKQQSAFAVLAAGVAYTFQRLEEGMTINDIFINYDFAIRLLTLFLVSIIVGHLKDNFSQKVLEKDEEIKHDKNEIKELTEIYETTLDIKNVLEDRLFNYGDGLAKIYSIVSELEGVVPQQILLKAVEVVSRIMNSENVGIYYCTENSGYCRLVASSQSSLQKSIDYTKITELSYAISKQEVFVNRELKEGLPMMAAPIFQENKLASIVMIWEMEFEKLTPYQSNLFSVLTRLITNSLNRAFLYMEAANERNLVEGTYIYTYQAMQEFFKIVQNAKEEYDTQYTIVKIESDETEYKAVSEKLVSQLRAYDYLGFSHAGELIILLSNTSNEEAKYFMSRLDKIGVHTEILEEMEWMKQAS